MPRVKVSAGLGGLRPGGRPGRGQGRMSGDVVQTLSGAPVTIHGDGTQQRQFTYVADVAQLIVQAAFLPQLDFNVVNIGSDDISSVADVISAVEAASEKALDSVNTPVATDAHHVQASPHSLSYHANHRN